MLAGNTNSPTGIYSNEKLYPAMITTPVIKQKASAFNHMQHQLHDPGAYHGYHMKVADTASDVLVDGASAAARVLVVYILLKAMGVKVKPVFFIYLLAADMILSQVLPKRTVPKT